MPEQFLKPPLKVTAVGLEEAEGSVDQEARNRAETIIQGVSEPRPDSKPKPNPRLWPSCREA